MNNIDLSFDDVLINPKFSEIRSRLEVSLDKTVAEWNFKLPIVGSNMDTIMSSKMANALYKEGAVGVLHRFQAIEDNVREFQRTEGASWVSVGVGDNEFERAIVLYEEGANYFVIDVAHGASIQVVEQYDKLRSWVGNDSYIIVGNFANAKSIETFNGKSTSKRKMDAAKIGIGGGSLCTTRVVTGCGRSTLSSLLDCNRLAIPLIADGGIRTSGDIAKAYAAGASLVMLGGMLSGTEETPGELITGGLGDEFYKRYRGSASKESYVSQGKIAQHRTAEGEATTVLYKGPVENVLNNIKAGLLSSFSYVGAKNFNEFKENAELIQVTNSVKIENMAHGKK